MRRRDLRTPMTAADVDRIRFAPARLGESYDMREVDDLLDALGRDLAGGRMAEDRLESARFSRTWLREGYRAAEVDRFLAWARATARAEAGGAYVPPGRRLRLPTSPRAVATMVWFTFVAGVGVYLWTR